MSGPAEHRATGRVVDLLETIAFSGGAMPLSDLSRRVGAAKSSLLPLLRTLCTRGYLESTDSGAYRIGQRAIELGSRVPARDELPEATHSALVGLTKRTGEAAFMGVLLQDRSGAVYIDRVSPPQTIRFAVQLGERRVLHATAVGKTILAHLSEEEREEIIRGLKLVRLTPKTIIAKAKLRESLATIRRAGVCVNVEEALVGGVAIAAPVFDRRGRVVAACAIGAPLSRARPRLRDLAEHVREAARDASRALGFVAGSASRGPSGS